MTANKEVAILNKFDVNEHLPYNDEVVLCYEKVTGEYFLGFFKPSRGWFRPESDAYGNDIRLSKVDFWMELPYKIRYELKCERNDDD